MSRSRIHWRQQLGHPGWEKGKQPGNNYRHRADPSQCGGDVDKVMANAPSERVTDKHGNVCTLPMKPEKRERIRQDLETP